MSNQEMTSKDQPNIKDKIVAYANSYRGLLSRREKQVAAVVAVGCVAFGAFVMNLDNKQNTGIRNDIHEDAKEQILNYDHIVDGGDTPVWVFGGTNLATIALNDGATCTIEYVTPGDNIFPDDGMIVDLMNCPEK